MSLIGVLKDSSNVAIVTFLSFIHSLYLLWAPVHTSTTSYNEANTIDAEEVAKFSRLAQAWWSQTGDFAALHTLNELRVPLVRDALVSQTHRGKEEIFNREPEPLKNLKILDVGCGGGILSEVIHKMLIYLKAKP